ncbi:MAG: DUF4132 domain-containing protein [Kordia sp.]|uniref:DUF4132 domain-containing protein n=1 Tax=Kordia sp. TaxID=1965332 RepID=UPI00385BEFAD
MGFKNIFKKILSTESETKDVNKVFEERLRTIVADCQLNYSYYNISLGKLKSYQALKAESTALRKEYIRYLIPKIKKLSKENSKKNWEASRNERYREYVYNELLSGLMRSNLAYTSAEIIEVFHDYISASKDGKKRFNDWPIGFSVQQIERIIKKEEMTPELKALIQQLLSSHLKGNVSSYWGSDLEKVRVKLEKMIFESENADGKTAPYILTEDRLGELINTETAALNDALKDHFYQLFHLFCKATAGKPSKRFLKNTSEIIDAIGISKYKTIVHPWLTFAATLKELETLNRYDHGNGRIYEHTSYEYLHEKNTVFLKGLAWSMGKFHDSTTLSILAKLTERAYKKLPGVGPTAAGVGNACIYTLGNTKGLEGISHLSRLKLKIKQNNTRKLVEKYIEEASIKLGVSSSEIEELSIPNFGLEDGAKTYTFDEYTLEISIQELGKVNSVWRKPDGKSQKTAPAFVKNSTKHAAKLKKAKSDVAQIKKYLTAQRDRIDRLYLDNRVWSYENFVKHYLNHGLVSFIAKRLLWQFKKGENFVTALYLNNQWITQEDTILDWVTAETEVRLWHPIHEAVAGVLFWRTKLESFEIKQPLKQAYREVYILTDAEINTKTYSNRMAAHILKQHQFNALTSIRGWKYSLLGAYDDGYDRQLATIQVKAHQIEAQFWINELNADDEFNDAGIWNYVATDQVRFIKNNEVIDLVEVPKLVLSEILRDVDLFVGVCSVGNDPEWRDNGGLPQYRDYWTSYSFGDLTEVAKTRKDILEKLLPRLKINKIATIDGKFLRVKGTKRTYKIHIGSSNILMEPNDQYLCIVPARGEDKKTKNIFLPFEGDRGLSLVLSKAFLLAEDDKITDTTILSQIN